MKFFNIKKKLFIIKNRIRAMLDPKKQFDLPKKFVKQLKDRYRTVI